MVEVIYNNTSYTGRLVNISAIENVTRTLIDNHYEDVYENIGYDVVLMDAFGATIILTVDTLSAITFPSVDYLQDTRNAE